MFQSEILLELPIKRSFNFFFQIIVSFLFKNNYKNMYQQYPTIVLFKAIYQVSCCCGIVFMYIVDTFRYCSNQNINAIFLSLLIFGSIKRYNCGEFQCNLSYKIEQEIQLKRTQVVAFDMIYKLFFAVSWWHAS
eukprot:TRINITY_DN1225_c1_g1_i12.p2 TRINITY_DN1225_c1_g1~~TRINITY_DN1225_c1_g1_i12.p2  ORF type:complete len:134 (-),score=0.04 TRINITY_DN1225_c1_g1_i12:80-481(-)